MMNPKLKKASTQTSLTEVCKTKGQTFLLLKKTVSECQRDCIMFDFLDSAKNGTSQNWSVSQILPVFNKDKKFYTPTFILKVDQSRYEKRDQVYRSLHRDRIQLNMEQNSHLVKFFNYSKLVPKPFKFNSYCLICRKDFQDYQKHIQSRSHISKMHHSQYNEDIDEICLTFGNSNRKIEKENPVPKIKKIRKTKKLDKIGELIETKLEIISII